jgi:hypothetical protein
MTLDADLSGGYPIYQVTRGIFVQHVRTTDIHTQSRKRRGSCPATMVTLGSARLHVRACRQCHRGGSNLPAAFVDAGSVARTPSILHRSAGGIRSTDETHAAAS